MNSVNEIRSTFLDYFAKNGHEIVPSSSLVPRNDPTLMFTNAGMVQFKNVFTGQEKRPYSRAATAQKCVRAGGKHNDLDNVGYTARHHTFFEMLGNFSFGDYFKPLAIELAWNLITKVYGLPKDKLLVTVYHNDDEAFDLWRKIAGFSDRKIIRIPTSDNFWSMGDTGPCGPCSEIFYDHGPQIAGGPPGSPDEDGDRFIEIWNLVFMQFETMAGGERIGLPKPSIDTGMGLERVSAILQGTHDNYATDMMRALIRASAEASNVPADGEFKVSHRVIADHLRAACFLVADGVLPSNEGRGYVLRRIMRRAMRHAQLLGCKDPLMWRLVPALVREMGQAYPELVRNEPLITETLLLEETRFRTTLVRGLAILEDESRTLVAGQQLPGEVAFKLYDTYGFPLDLTQDALRARGVGVDTDAFAASMAQQKAAARKAWAGSGEAATETVWFSVKDNHGATEFLGYETEQAEGVVGALVQDGQLVTALSSGEKGQVIVNQTPFYAESGGQVGDSGVIMAAGLKFRVTNTLKKLGDLFVHEGVVESGEIRTEQSVELSVDSERRSRIRAHHSATHLLHEALRRVLGDHVAQKGSLVSAERLRFDFVHPKPISDEELAAVEAIANSVVLQNDKVVTRLMDQETAVASGARALFGEKYGDEVRVVSMGRNAPDAATKVFSVELCGGTHVERTGEIGLLTIVADGPVASGVRRIEAKTGEQARLYLNDEARRLREVAALLKSPVDKAVERVSSLIEDRKRLERELADARKKLAMSDGAAGAAPEQIGEIKFLGRIVSGVDMKDMKSLVEEAREALGGGVVAFVNVSDDNKAGLVIGVSADQTGRINAVDLVRAGAAALGGRGGGGRPDMAQAGGPDGGNAQAALDAVIVALRAAVGVA